MTDDTASTSRPRRSTRAPARVPDKQITPFIGKRKAPAHVVEPAEQLRALLQEPKSALTTMDMSDILNVNVWSSLSVESRAHLCTLLPPSAFHDYQPSIESHHPSKSPDAMDIDADGPLSSRSPDLLNPALFTDPHFLASVKTFQDHLYSGWLTDAQREKVRAFQEGVQDGSVHAPWKDEVWERDNAPSVDTRTAPLAANTSTQPESSMRAGEAAELKLADLAKHGILKVGDVLAYRRPFSALSLTIEKDVLIESIHPKSWALTVLVEPGTAQNLPIHLLTPDMTLPSPSLTRSASVTSPSSLETLVLDIDGRVERGRRPNGNAWKCVTVWRWADGMQQDNGNGRGGRESHGTLFYLRGCYYHDR